MSTIPSSGAEVTRKAIISDIHGNLEALQAVLADIADKGIETIYCLGDLIGYGPDPGPCIDLCEDFAVCLLGNHDNGALFDPEGFSSGAEKAIFWTRQQIESSEPKNRDRWRFLASLPRTVREGTTMYVHGSPRSPLCEYVFPEDVYNDRKIQRIFTYIQQYCFQGHTHVPGVFTEDCRFFSPRELNGDYRLADQKVMINVGSVGQPRDNDPRACYVTVEDLSVSFHRVEYDFRVTQEKIFAIPDLDDFLGTRLAEGR